MITRKNKLEKKCVLEQEIIFKLTALQDSPLIANGILKGELTLTMQYIDITQATTEKLRAYKREP